MEKIEQLRHVVCQARYFCQEFPGSWEQKHSRCHNCGAQIYHVCISGAEKLPVICKPCYDVLKYSFNVVDQRDDSRRNSFQGNLSKTDLLDSEVTLDVLASTDKLPDDGFEISKPRNIRHLPVNSLNCPNSPLQEESHQEKM